MSKLAITLACGTYDRTHALEVGAIQPAGIDLRYIPAGPGETFWRQLQFAEYDASEMSMSAYIALKVRSDERFVAIPVFTSRAFRHGCIFVRSGSDILRPEDLAGARIGVPQYHMTAALWIRGTLADDYGVDTAGVTWVQGGLDTVGYPERIQLDLPKSIRIEREADRPLSDLLLTGQIDAIIGAEYPAPFRDGDQRISQLFPNFVEVEKEYFARTQLFPIMHCIAIRRDVYEAHPWIAANLVAAFEASRRRAEAQLAFPGAPVTMLPWQVAHWSDAMQLMGPGLWRYGVEANRLELETMCRYSFAQGLISSIPSIESLFARETLAGLPTPVADA